LLLQAPHTQFRFLAELQAQQAEFLAKLAT
jgi:hypothetical protein